MFHCLTESNADMLAGRSKAARSEGAWLQVYRALGHRETSKRCKNRKMMQKFPAPLIEFADTFCHLQVQREEADYNPHSHVYLEEVWWYLFEAEDAIEEFHKSDTKDRKAFAVYLLVNLRKS